VCYVCVFVCVYEGFLVKNKNAFELRGKSSNTHNKRMSKNTFTRQGREVKIR